MYVELFFMVLLFLLQLLGVEERAESSVQMKNYTERFLASASVPHVRLVSLIIAQVALVLLGRKMCDI
jgi:hypothetical protein